MFKLSDIMRNNGKVPTKPSLENLFKDFMIYLDKEIDSKVSQNEFDINVITDFGKLGLQIDLPDIDMTKNIREHLSKKESDIDLTVTYSQIVYDLIKFETLEDVEVYQVKVHNHPSEFTNLIIIVNHTIFKEIGIGVMLF